MVENMVSAQWLGHATFLVTSPEGYRILGTTSGVGALAILGRATADLILLDVSMPEMDGFETCRRIKSLEGAAGIPVIFITARHEAESVVRGFESGGCDYLTKPFNREEITARVRLTWKTGVFNAF